MTEMSALKSQIGAEERKIKTDYFSLGQKYYQAHKNDRSPEFPEEIQDIQQHEAAIEKYQTRIAAMEAAAAARQTRAASQEGGQIQCPQCGAGIPSDSLFCPRCGSKIPRSAVTQPSAMKYCVNCGKAIPADSLFCPECGSRQQDFSADGDLEEVSKQSDEDTAVQEQQGENLDSSVTPSMESDTHPVSEPPKEDAEETAQGEENQTPMSTDL